MEMHKIDDGMNFFSKIPCKMIFLQYNDKHSPQSKRENTDCLNKVLQRQVVWKGSFKHPDVPVRSGKAARARFLRRAQLPERNEHCYEEKGIWRC